MGGYAWVTLATNDSYSLGALVLAHSLKKSKTAHKSVVLITPAVSQPMREQLQTVFDVIKVVDVLDSKDEAHLALMQRPELGITFTKIHCWKLVEFDKCVFLDADTLVVRNCDELFEREEFSAAPDVSWPDCFNSGVFVYKPSVKTFNELLQFAVEKGSFDGGDQGLLNQFFSGWATEDIRKHLPFVYNLTSVAAYSYIPAFKHYGSETRIVHFIGAGKPWLQQLDPATRTITPTSGSEHLAPLLQQWWDLFCEKVHPNLSKNLESNNDGMSHPPVAACSNSLPIALTDDSQTPRLIEPCTPYREKDDFRQYNLPYQPFDVKGSSGELLNVEFLLASVNHPTPPEVFVDEQRREGDKMEEKNGQEERDEKEEKNDSGAKENESRKDVESPKIVSKTDINFRTEERKSEWKEAEVGEQKQEQEKQEQSVEPEKPPPAIHPFDYDSFFPDETCINKYLEQNVMTYQPYDSHTFQQHENHNDNNSEDNSLQHPHENNSEINLSVGDPQPPEETAPSLPRFLTIPENDKRQIGNTEAQIQTKQVDLQATGDLPQTDLPSKSPDQSFSQKEEVEEKRELTKSKSMPYLRYDVTAIPSPGSIWKSQPNVNVDPNRKYSMPKLKPILPRQNSLSKSVPSIAPKVTLYTEFLMSSEYKDPADLPKDKVGFVETLIHKKSQLRRSKSAADIGDKFGPLPYIFSPEEKQPVVLKEIPLLHLESELYDLSQCKRQMGNKPKATGADGRKENRHSLPALKPLVPPKDKKSTLIKKRKSKELSPGDGGREKIFKREPKMPKERKRECKTTPRNVSEAATGNSVSEILSGLRELSKNYQHFFGVEPRPRDRTIKCKNATVQADELLGSKWDTSEYFLKTSGPDVFSMSRATQTPREKKSEREESAVDSKFRHFRNYVKEKSKTSQKGLLSIQDLVLKSSGKEDEVTEDVRVSSESLDSCSELERGSAKGHKEKLGYLLGGAHERKDSAKGDGMVERDIPGKGISVSPQSFAAGDEIEEDNQGDREFYRTPANENNVEDNSKGTVKSALHPTWWGSKEVNNSRRSNSPPADMSKSKDTPSNHSKEEISEYQCFPVASGTEGAVLPSRVREAHTNGLEGENFEKKNCSTEIESNEDPELANKERDVGESTERSVSLKFNSREDSARTEAARSSCSDRITPNGSGCSEVFRTALEAAEPAALTPTGEEPEEEILSKPSIERYAGTSSPERILSEGNQPKTNGKSRAEVFKDGGTETRCNKSQKKPTLCCGNKKDMKGKESCDKLKNTNDAPRSARFPLPTSRGIAIEVVEELIAKATLQQNPTSAPPRPIPREIPKPIPSPRKFSGPPPENRNSPANDSPDRTASPVGERTCAAARKLSPPSPSIPRNGNALPESHEDMKVNSGIAGAIAQLSLEAGSEQGSESAAVASTAHQEYVRRQNWETGNMDYMGRDSFDNIWSKICQTLEGKELEEAGPAAVSPKQFKDPSATIQIEEARTPEQPPAADTLASLSTVLQKCPGHIETLPGEPTAGPVEDDEIIFSKPDNRQSCLTDITEVEDDGKENSAIGAKPVEARKVKLSDILQPEVSSSVPKETNRSDGADAEAKASVQKTTEQTIAGEKAGAPAGEKSERPQKEPETIEVQPEANKADRQTGAACELPLSSQVPSVGGTDTSVSSVKADKSGADKKTEECTTVAIPSPPISFSGVPFTEKDKKAQFRRKPEKTAEDKFDPIPLPPPETPTHAPEVKTSDFAKDQGKQKKGVFTKILEMVGVTPKERTEDEISKSVFYDVEGSAPSEQEPAKDESSVTKEPEKQPPTAETEMKEVTQKQVDDLGKGPDDVGELKTEEIKEPQEKVVLAAQSKDAEGISLLESEETKKETISRPPEAQEVKHIAEEEPHEASKSDGKPMSPVEKPTRNVSPTDPVQLSKNSIQISPRSKSPSPKLTLPKDPPETAITTPTPPPEPDFPVRKSSGLLKVDETILETPPIPEPPKEGAEESVKGRVLTEVEDIIGKAKREVESRLQDRRSAEKETGESSDLINTMKLMVDSEQTAQVQSPEVQMEELRVTSEEERMRHKGEVVSSKLSDQILKAIPPPRRKAISEGSASTSAIPKPPPAPEQKTVPGETKPKTPKPSSIPVPPPRSRGKPTHPAPPKGKGKK